MAAGSFFVKIKPEINDQTLLDFAQAGILPIAVESFITDPKSAGLTKYQD